MCPRVAVLDIKYRVLARLLDHLGKIEIEGGIVLAIKHHEADGILADLFHDFAQGHEVPRPLGHLYRLAGAQEARELDDLHVEFGPATADRFHRSLHALDVATVVRAPYVDHLAKAAIALG